MTTPEPPVTADHTPERLSAALDVIEREYVAFRLHHAAAQTRDSPEGFAARFREWIAPPLAAHLADVEARLAAVEALHREGEARLCKHDLLLWPCPTYRALHPDPSEEAT